MIERYKIKLNKYEGCAFEVFSISNDDELIEIRIDFKSFKCIRFYDSFINKFQFCRFVKNFESTSYINNYY